MVTPCIDSDHARGVTRREFLGAAAAGGLGAVLAAGPRPAGAQQRELTLLAWSHFVPDSDKELKRQAEEFGKLKGLRVRTDHIAHLQMAAKRAAEAQSRSGHDLIHFWVGDPDLYFELLVDLDDVAQDVGAKAGGWLNEDFKYRGKWKALPWYTVVFPIAYRTDLLDKVGEKVPDTWDDLLRVGKKLKAIGHPVGIQVSHCNDANHILRGLLWSYGASFVGEDGKTVTINSPQTAQTIEYMKQFYKEAMEPEVLSWDDASNNRCLNGGKCSLILNPISAYESAKDAKAKIPGTPREIHEVIDHALPPRGPVRRAMSGQTQMIAIWAFSKNIDLAKEFLRYHFAPEQQHKFIEASRGYNLPALKALSTHPIWATNPKYKFATEIGQYTRHPAWPGPPTAASQVVWDLFIIPDMFAQAVTGRLSTQDAMAWAEKEIKEVYAGRKTKRSS
jgi:multiple sugar transport system substrate-binding protein